MRVKNIKPYYAIINRVPILFMLLLICSHKTAVGAESDYLTLPMPQKFIPALQADGKPWGAIPADGKKRIYLIGMTEKGGLVYDLHTRQSISFDKFPNFESISGIMF